MALIVQKYGGTSVGSPERIRNVAKRLLETQREDNDVVAVISAMAGVTDNLIKLARETSPHPTEREMDVLLATGERGATALVAIAVNALGGRAISLTGAEAGVLTDRFHTKAKIANTTLLARKAPSRDNGESTAPGERRRSPRQPMRPTPTATTTAKKPRMAGPMPDSVKAWTESSTPERVRKVPRMVRLKVATSRDRFQTRSIPRRSWTMTECR